MTTGLTNEQIQTLDNIIATQGDCMNDPYSSRLCETCPLRNRCFLDMLSIGSIAGRRDHRYKLAAEKLLETTILGLKEP